MKLDKIKFGELIALIANIVQRKNIDAHDITLLDDLIDLPDAQQVAVYPKNENVEALMKHMAAGTNKIGAIREHRAITGMGLKESKDAVERYWPVVKPNSYTYTELKAKLNAGEFIDERNRDVIAAFLDQL